MERHTRLLRAVYKQDKSWRPSTTLILGMEVKSSPSKDIREKATASSLSRFLDPVFPLTRIPHRVAARGPVEAYRIFHQVHSITTVRPGEVI